jgi:hypothetical protein
VLSLAGDSSPIVVQQDWRDKGGDCSVLDSGYKYASSSTSFLLLSYLCEKLTYEQVSAKLHDHTNL